MRTIYQPVLAATLGEYRMSEPETPYFLIRERGLLANLDKIDALRRVSGTKVLLALKCFSTWGVFPILQGALDGTVASSPYEARLGAETFGGETQNLLAWLFPRRHQRGRAVRRQSRLQLHFAVGEISTAPVAGRAGGDAGQSRGELFALLPG